MRFQEECRILIAYKMGCMMGPSTVTVASSNAQIIKHTCTEKHAFCCQSEKCNLLAEYCLS